MGFKIHEQDGSWMVSKDGENTIILGGDPIDYEDYLELKDAPHKAPELFERDKKGKLVRKVLRPTKKQT